MIYQFLKDARLIYKSSPGVKEAIVEIISQYPGNISIIVISSLIFNLGLIFLLKKYWAATKRSVVDYLNSANKTYSKKEIIYVLSTGFLLSLLTYIKVITKFFSQVIAEPGDAYNHFARLKESKNLILSPDRSYFHWDTIFHPQGLSAFDGDITYYVDFIHLLLSPFIESNIIFNLIMFSTYSLSFLFCYLLSRELNQNKFISLFTAYIFTFSHFHFKASLLWINLVNVQFIPLYFFFTPLYFHHTSVISLAYPLHISFVFCS